MNGLLKNVQDITSYIDNSFKAHFDDSLQKIHDYVERVKTTLQALKQNGVALQNEAEKIEEEEKKQKEAAFQKESKKEELSGFGVTLKNMWNYITSFFVSQKSKNVVPVPKEQLPEKSEVEADKKASLENQQSPIESGVEEEHLEVPSLPDATQTE